MTERPPFAAPPAPRSKSALPFALFVERFKPLVRENGSIRWDKTEARPKSDYDRWWTVIEEDRTYLVPGYRNLLSVAYVRCEIPWTGEPHDHPYYCCSNERRDHD